MSSQLKAEYGLTKSADDPKIAKALLAIAAVRYQTFCERFGRAPKCEEPLLFDSTYEHPIIASPAEQVQQIMTAAKIADVDPSLVLNFLALTPIN